MNNSIDLERQDNDYVAWVDEEKAITPDFKGEFAYIQDKKIYEGILSEFFDHIVKELTREKWIILWSPEKQTLIKTFIEK